MRASASLRLPVPSLGGTESARKTGQAAALGRALPAQRQAFRELEDILPGAAPAQHFKERAPQFPAKPAPYPAKWEYTPFGPQKQDPEPDAPFQRPAKPDQPAPEPEPAPLPAPHVPETFRAPARLHSYHDELLDPAVSPPRRRQGQAPAEQEKDRDHPRRLGRSVYDAMETHGHFGLVDGGETMAGGVRRVVVHVPKRNRGYALDLRQGEVVYAISARGTQAKGRLDVLFVSRHKYVPPGHAVTSCAIGVPEVQWRRFMV